VDGVALRGGLAQAQPVQLAGEKEGGRGGGVWGQQVQAGAVRHEAEHFYNVVRH
jgi:hypothetical protein